MVIFLYDMMMYGNMNMEFWVFLFRRMHCDWFRVPRHIGGIHYVDFPRKGSNDMLFLAGHPSLAGGCQIGRSDGNGLSDVVLSLCHLFPP